ncbi:MAG: hypothetical protein H3C34_11180 [Caldilineaceae bacterium]|nr:hypothetical protein [Caldilineaceae bacterium]
MGQDMHDDPRPANDSRKRTPVESRKVATVESKPSLGQRWRDAQPTKMTLFWACLASVVLTIVVGFTWGGWVSAGNAQTAAETMARDAVVQRLAPICVAQFNQDPDKALKLDEMNALTSYQRAQFVQDQGWATISGNEKPDRKVADACTKLLLEMIP